MSLRIGLYDYILLGGVNYVARGSFVVNCQMLVQDGELAIRCSQRPLFGTGLEPSLKHVPLSSNPKP